MTNHNVLVMAYYFPPMGLSGVQRVAKFVKYLPDFGWHPYVVTTGPTLYYAKDESLMDEVAESGATIFRTEPSARMKKLLESGTVKMPRERLRRTASRLSSAFFIPDNKQGWARKALQLAREVVASVAIDVIFVSGPPFSTMMAGAQLSAETGIPLVLDYRDLWLGNQFHSYPTLWHENRHKALEHATLSRASRITVTNRRIKERMINNYPHLDFRDVVIIPHGWDEADFATAAPLSNLITDDPSGDVSSRPLRITYTGTFYDVITPVPFFKALKKLRKERPDVSVQLHVAGMLRDEYKNKARRMKLDDAIVDHGYLPHPQSVQLLLESDVLWITVGNTRNADTISSAKLYEYFGTRKPLLASVPEGALRKDAQRYGAAWITEPDDVQGIMQAIIDLHERWRQGAFPIANEEFVMQHRRKTLTGELARTLATSLRVV